MNWEVLLGGLARNSLKRIPASDQRRILATLDTMQEDPFSGDVVRLNAQPTAWRRRVGDWRIFFDVDPERQLVVVHDVVRRTSTTY